MLIFCWARSGLPIFARHQSFCFFSSFCLIIFVGLGYSIASPWCAFKGLVVPWRPGSRPPSGTQLGSRRATLSRISDRDQEFPDCQCCSYGLWIMQLWIMDNGALILDNTNSACSTWDLSINWKNSINLWWLPDWFFIFSYCIFERSSFPSNQEPESHKTKKVGSDIERT